MKYDEIHIENLDFLQIMVYFRRKPNWDKNL